MSRLRSRKGVLSDDTGSFPALVHVHSVRPKRNIHSATSRLARLRELGSQGATDAEGAPVSGLGGVGVGSGPGGAWP